MVTDKIVPLPEYQSYATYWTKLEANDTVRVYLRRWTDGKWFDADLKPVDAALQKQFEKARRDRTHVRL